VHICLHCRHAVTLASRVVRTELRLLRVEGGPVLLRWMTAMTAAARCRTVLHIRWSLRKTVTCLCFVCLAFGLRRLDSVPALLPEDSLHLWSHACEGAKDSGPSRVTDLVVSQSSRTTVQSTKGPTKGSPSSKTYEHRRLAGSQPAKAKGRSKVSRERVGKLTSIHRHRAAFSNAASRKTWTANRQVNGFAETNAFTSIQS